MLSTAPTCRGCGSGLAPGRAAFNHLPAAPGFWDCGDSACLAPGTTRAPLLEMVGSIAVVKKVKIRATLEAGMRGRLSPDGPVVIVDRVSPGAAYVHKVYDPPLEREVGNVEAREQAVATLHKVLRNAEATEQQVYAAAHNAGHAARAIRIVLVSQGPPEPGISPSAPLYPAPPAGEGEKARDAERAAAKAEREAAKKAEREAKAAKPVPVGGPKGAGLEPAKTPRFKPDGSKAKTCEPKARSNRVEVAYILTAKKAITAKALAEAFEQKRPPVVPALKSHEIRGKEVHLVAQYEPPSSAASKFHVDRIVIRAAERLGADWRRA